MTLFLNETKRLLIYQQLIDRIDDHEVFMMCPQIAKAIEHTTDPVRAVTCNTNLLDLQAQFPELYEQRPKGTTQDNLWWKLNGDGMEMRKQALLNAIKLLQDAPTTE